MTKIYINNGGIPSLTDTNSVMSGYLPLSGGTMTGPISMGESSLWTSNKIVLVQADGQSEAFVQKANDTGHIRLDGGSDYNSGASFIAYGKSSSDNAGNFKAYASNGTNNATLLGTPAGELTWSGTFKATTLQSTSDIRKKSEIKEVAPDLSSLKTYEYVLKDDGKRHVGLIAQEVEKVIPEAVSEDDGGFKSLDYNSVVAALVGEVNALKKRVAELEEK